MDKQGLSREAQLEGLHPSHEEEADGCDVVLTDEEATPDEDLPVAEGGVA
jgi:hypothetical protein